MASPGLYDAPPNPPLIPALSPVALGKEFKSFFEKSTGHPPYPFQTRFATAETLPHLLRAPTGSGKTATAVIGWLWRKFKSGLPTPRRLVYCLPMRVLVEQSAGVAVKWIKELELDVQVHVLMGGADLGDWFLDPEKPAILIGTQDMLLSRALNRGYAESRFHWPIDFGLLNNDCLWVYDEPQLMANGVSTSSQLAGLRKALGTAHPCPSVWMSATLEPCWLDTIDFRDKFPAAPLELDDTDYAEETPLHKRMTAAKTINPLSADASDAKAVAEAVKTCHERDTQTLVVMNTVKRAKAVYAALATLTKPRKGAKTASDDQPPPKLLLIHSRFRPQEREKLNELLQAGGEAAKNRIIVATQVVEAGVDISARTLVTELAPWTSVVQRIGRCNRTGDDGPGKVYWLDLDAKLSPPYSAEDLEFSRTQLRKLEGKSVSPKAIEDFQRGEGIVLPFEHKHVLRRRDLLDLFDTAPDLSGNDIDVSRFVRSDDPESDVQLFWRDWSGKAPGRDEPEPSRAELCRAPIGEARALLQKLKEAKKIPAFMWDHLDEKWVPIVDLNRLRPGLTIMLHVSAGGYSEVTGFDLEASGAVTPVGRGDGKSAEGTASDPRSVMGVPVTLKDHTENVCGQVEELADLIPAEHREVVRRAARWHDLGKAHWVFQDQVRDKVETRLMAKSGRKGRLCYARKFFRHELASALGAYQQGEPFPAVYLIGSHHGRSRLSIRTLPKEDPTPENPKTFFALGVHDRDALPAVELGGGVSVPAIEIDLTPMRLGGDRSWTANALKLLAEMGPFRLAYLEAIVRAADVRASKKEAGVRE